MFSKFVYPCQLGSKKVQNKSSGATALQGFGRQSGRRRSAKLVPTFADRGVSRGQQKVQNTNSKYIT